MTSNGRPAKPRTVCVVLVDRANYGRLKPVMRAIDEHPRLALQTVAAGAMVLERFGLPMRVVQEDGFRIDAEVYVELEGSAPLTMAKSVGFGVVEFANEFRRLAPDLVLLIGDRYEALSVAIAAAYMNLCIVHVQGGEVSGSIDESARHAITRFAHFHFPSTRRAAEYLVRMGENPATILGIGCPSSDIAHQLDGRSSLDAINRLGSGATIDTTEPFLLAAFHPTTTEYGGEHQQMEALLEALGRVQCPTILLWPNIDAGANHVSEVIRRFRDQIAPDWLRTIINLPPEVYLRTLASAACAVGNSSSFVREASFLGTPVVLVGNRQEGRETGLHVASVRPRVLDVEMAIRQQLDHGRYASSALYGDGHVSQRIANALARLTPYVQKRLEYLRMRDGAAKRTGHTLQFTPYVTEELESCVS